MEATCTLTLRVPALILCQAKLTLTTQFQEFSIHAA